MILCSGEALIDMLPRRTENGETAYLPVAGGAVFNTAIALGRLGEKTGFFSGISTDLFGGRLVDALKASGVACDACIRTARPSTLAFVELVDGNAQYTFFDENSAGRMITAAQLPELASVTAAHFGAISLIGEPCGTAFETLAMRLSDQAVISLDPNIRPSFITDETAYRSRLERMIAIADIVKISDDDFTWIAGTGDFRKMAQVWLNGRTRLVVVTRGAQGVTAYTRDGAIDVPAVKTEVVDTVGAGDSFDGGLLAGLRREGLLTRDALAEFATDDLRRAVEFAAKIAAVTVSRPGADPPWLHEIS